MEIAIILIFSSVLFSTAFLFFINSLPSMNSKQVVPPVSELENLNLRPVFSLDNAGIVNKESSAPNCPVRPIGEEYFDGITSELTNERNDPNLAKLIINIRNVV